MKSGVVDSAGRAVAGEQPQHRKRLLAVVPAVGVAFVPKLVCPLCWPAYAALMSTLGIGFLPTAPYLLPLTIVCLIIAVGSLAWRARRGNGIGAVLVGIAGAMVILVARFHLESNAALYGGLVLLIAAFAYDWWPWRRHAGSCPACSSTILSQAES